LSLVKGEETTHCPIIFPLLHARPVTRSQFLEGETFAVVDLTIENLDDEATSVSSIMSFEVKDKDSGYAYDMDMMATMALDQQIDGKVQPGDKIRGKLAFEVPKDSNALQLVFDFGLFDYAQAKFNLGPQN
jgi:hypothetical protein